MRSPSPQDHDIMKIRRKRIWWCILSIVLLVLVLVTYGIDALSSSVQLQQIIYPKPPNEKEHFTTGQTNVSIDHRPNDDEMKKTTQKGIHDVIVDTLNTTKTDEDATDGNNSTTIDVDGSISTETIRPFDV